MAFKVKEKPSNNNLLLVIDGSALVATNFYGGIPPYIQNERDINKANALCRRELRQTKDGIYTHAVASTLSTVFSLTRFYNATHVAVCFDKNSQTTFRKKMYPEYKATRHQKPDALKEQIDTTRLILKNIGIPAFWSDEYEGDDIAGSIISRFKNECGKVLFVTKDHDWLQLIDRNVSGIMMMPSEERAEKMRADYAIYVPENDDAANPFTPKTFHKCVTFNADVTLIEDGVYPKQIPELKGLAGDSSDNISGVKGIGPVVAEPLLLQYHTIDGIYAAIDACDGDEALLSELARDMKMHGIARNPIPKLIAGRDMAFLSRQLATIVTTLPITFPLDDLKVCIKGDMMKKAVDYYELDEFQYMVDELIGIDAAPDNLAQKTETQEKKLEESVPDNESADVSPYIYILHGYWNTRDYDGADIISVSRHLKKVMKKLDEIADSRAIQYVNFDGEEEYRDYAYELIGNDGNYAKFYIEEMPLHELFDDAYLTTLYNRDLIKDAALNAQITGK